MALYKITKPDTLTALQVSEQDVTKAIMSFPRGSAASPDGLRPQYLLELILSRENGKTFLREITAFVNILLVGQCHNELSHISIKIQAV